MLFDNTNAFETKFKDQWVKEARQELSVNLARYVRKGIREWAPLWIEICALELDRREPGKGWYENFLVEATKYRLGLELQEQAE